MKALLSFRAQRGICFFFLASLLLCLPASLPATTVSGTIQKPDGTPINGTIEFTLSQPAKTTTPPVVFAPVKTSCAVTAGQIAAGCTLQGNDTLDPAGTFYRVRVLDLNNLVVVPSANYTLSGAAVDLGSLPVTATDTLVPPTGSVTGDLNVTGNLTVGGSATFGADPESFSHLRLLNLTADPFTATNGSIFHRSDLNRIRFRAGGLEIFDGTQYLPVSASSAGTIEFGANLSLPGLYSASFKRLNELRLVDPFLWLESGVNAKIDAAITDCGGLQCRVLLPTNLSAGSPTRSLWPETAAILDLRGDENDPYTGGVYLSPFKFVSRMTAAADSSLQIRPTLRVLTFHDSGGDNQTGGPKDQYNTIAADLYSAGRGEDLGTRTAIFKYGEGDAAPLFSMVDQYGNCLEGGGECGVGLRGQLRQGQSVASGTVSSYTGGSRTIAVSSGSNLHTLGVGRYVINTTGAKVYTTGSVSSISGTPPVVTGSGTAWATQFGSGAHSDLCFSQVDDDASFPGGTAKFVVPVRTVDSDTSLTLDFDPQGADKGWPGDNNGSSYRVYKCAQIESHSLESVGATTASIVHVSGGTTDWAASDTLEVPLGWAWFGSGATVLVQNYLPSYEAQGLKISNSGSDEPLRQSVNFVGKSYFGLLFQNSWECYANNTNCSQGSPTGIYFANMPTIGIAFPGTGAGAKKLIEKTDNSGTTGTTYIAWSDSADCWNFEHSASVTNVIQLCPTVGSLAGDIFSVRSTGRVQIGTNPATAGGLRLSNNNSIQARNAANSANIVALNVSASDRVQLAQSGTPVEFAGGVYNNGAGFKHARVSTGSISASSSAAVTVSWTTAFADANYTASCSVVESTAGTNSLRIHHLESVSAASVVVRIVNDDTGAAKTGTLHCTAIHD